MATMTFVRAMNAALHEEMTRDPSIVVYGEDTVTGGYFRIGEGLFEAFGPNRVFDTPIAETAIAGSAVGMAITGLRPVVDMSFADFFAIAMDEISNKAAKWRYMHGGRFTLPIVYRMAIGMIGGAGAEHSQSPETHFVHSPGLRVVVPSNPRDAKGLLVTSIRDNNPVCFLEHKGLYFVKGEVPDEPYAIPFGKADICRTGKDLTIVAWAQMVTVARAAADTLAKEGIDVEVIDPRTLAPLDKDTILSSVRKTGRAIILHESPRTCGVGGEIAATIAEECLYDLRAPIKRLAGADVPVPQNGTLEKFIVPNAGDVVATARELISA